MPKGVYRPIMERAKGDHYGYPHNYIQLMVEHVDSESAVTQHLYFEDRPQNLGDTARAKEIGTRCMLLGGAYFYALDAIRVWTNGMFHGDWLCAETGHPLPDHELRSRLQKWLDRSW